MPVAQHHAYLDAPEKVVRRLLRERNITSQFHHWRNLWMMMPSVAHRLAMVLTTAIPEPKRAGCLLGLSYLDGAVVMDSWAESSSTLLLVQDAVRKMFLRCLDASKTTMHVNHVEWEPRKHGPLSKLIEQFPNAVVTSHDREAGLAESVMDIHHLLMSHVYCEMCELTLRSTYIQLMHLPEIP